MGGFGLGDFVDLGGEGFELLDAVFEFVVVVDVE